MKNLKALILMLISVNVFSQEFDDVMINPFWSFYSENYLDAVSSGRGNTGIGALGNLSAVYLNPAAINIPGKYQADIQYTYKSNQDWLPSLQVSDLYLKQNPFSGSVGFGARLGKNFQTGFLYGNPNSLTLNIGNIIITNEFGEEIGRYEAYEKYIVHSFSVPVVYTIDNVRLGLNLNYSLHRRYANFQDDEFIGKFDRFNVHAGIIVQAGKQLTIGASFIPEVSGEVKGSSNVVANETTITTLPMKIGAGFEYVFKGNPLRLSGDFTYTHTGARDNLKDQFAAHAGLEYGLNKYWTIRGGFFNRQDPRDISGTTWLNPQESYDQFFLTAGTTYKTKNTAISFALMDSHLSSNMKITLINAGASFNF